MAYLALASTFTVTGSLLSCLATLAVLLYCTTSGGRHTSLRHSLVVNLCLAGKAVLYVSFRAAMVDTVHRVLELIEFIHLGPHLCQLARNSRRTCLRGQRLLR